MNNEYNLVAVDFNPFVNGEIEKTILATESQQEIWSSCIIGGDEANCSFNLSISIRLAGVLKYDCMEMALQDLVNRHEALRSDISADGKYLYIYKNITISLPLEDLSIKEPLNQKNYLDEVTRNDASTPFDLQKGSLFKLALFKISEQEYILKITTHHIVADGWSLGIILEDLGKLYSAYSKGEIPDLEKAIPFSQYADETKKFSESSLYQGIENYWVKQYSDVVPELDLPTDFPRPLHRTYKSKNYCFTITPELLASIKDTGKKAGTSLVNTLMAAFEIYLHRLTGQQDIVLGLPSAGQSVTGNYSVVGHCVNLLPLRSQPDGNLSFIDYLKLRKVQLMDDYEHQQFTFGSLLKKLNIARDSSRVPLIPVVFNIDVGMDANVSFYGLNHKLISNAREYENFEIFIDVTGDQNSLTLEWSYNMQLFLPETIKRMADEFENLMEQVVKDPNIQIKAISIGNKDLALQIAKWNDTTVHYTKDKSFTKFIDTISIQYPGKTAISFKDRKLSYKELNELSNRLANYLIQNGVQKGDIIGVAVNRSPELIVSLLAVIKSGAAYVPIDPEYPKDRIEFMLVDSAAKMLITNAVYAEQFDSAAKELNLESIWPLLSSYAEQVPDVSLSGSDLAYVLYTSGSTGKPKGVLIQHHSLTNFLLSMQKAPGMTSEDVLLALTTISFDIAGLELYLPLISGAEIVLTDTHATKDARLMLELIEKRNVSIVQATPSSWRMLLDVGLSKKHKLKALCGGEAFPVDLAEKLLNCCESVWNMYGPTETTIWSSIKKLMPDHTITIGKPIDNTQIYILDEYQNIVPIGASGEIYIGGEGLAKGYMNRADLTAEKFIPNPFDDQNKSKLYRTGDLGKYLNNGDIQCLGRSDQQVKIRGYRIEPGEIEYHLVKLEGIKEAVVIIREDNIGDQRLVAYVVPDNSQSDKNYEKDQNTENEITIKRIVIPEYELSNWKDILKESLPDYMIPGEYVALEKLPTTNNGKIDRKRLPKPNNANKPFKENIFIAPRTPAEKLIAKIWSDLLHIENIDVTKNFFELGGHSLMAIKVMFRIESEIGKRLPIAMLLENPTIEKLAREIQKDEEKLHEDLPSLSLIPNSTIDGERLPLPPNTNITENREYTLADVQIVPAVEPQIEIWLAYLMGQDNASKAYNLPLNIEFTGPLDRNILGRALQELVNRHELLRANFSNDGMQIHIHKHIVPKIHYQDLSDLKEIQQKSFLNEFYTTDANTAFNLFYAPLFRVALFKLTENKHNFLFTVHHSIADGWSLGIIFDELASLYSSMVDGEMPSLKPAPLFSEYTIGQQAFYKSKDFQIVEDFWVDQYKDGIPTLEIPTDFSRPKHRTFQGKRIYYSIDDQIFKQFKSVGTKAGCSASISFRAALEVFLYRLTGQSDLVTGMPLAGQLGTSFEDMVAHCVNLLPLKTTIDGEVSFTKYLEQRKKYLLDAFYNKDLTFGSLLKKLNLNREQARVPLVSVMMNYDYKQDDNAFKNLTHQFLPTQKLYENFDISINVEESTSGFKLRWDYNTDLFTPATISQLNESFTLLLKTISKQPDIQIDNILLYDKEALVHQVSQWNNTFSPYDKTITVTKLISETAIRYPNHTALTFKGKKTSYNLLESKSNQLARLLIAKGVEVGDKIGLALDRSTEMLISLLAIMKAGAAYIPLDPQYPKDRVEYMLADSGAKILITSNAYKESFKSNATQLLIELAWNELDAYEPSLPEIPVRGDNLAYILYTSGSTGLPKGVQIEHHSLVNFLLSMQKQPGINKNDVVLAITTISFDIAGLELYLPLITGAAISLADTDTARNGVELLQFIKDSKVTIIQATPSTWRMLIDAGWENPLPIKALSGGEPLTKDLAEKLLKRCSSLWNMYGPTETTVWSTLKEILPNEDIISIGRPIDNTSIFILDKNQNYCPIGASGELCIAGDGLSAGYLNRPELTSEKFISTGLLHNGARIYRTGDLGKFLSNGEIQCLGRIDQQVKLRGHRIELGEIEYHLLKLNGVKEGVVAMREDNPGDQRLVAYIITGNDILTREETDLWKTLLKEELPYYMIPNDWVLLQKMPLTSNRKVDKKALPKPEYKQIVNEAISRPLRGPSEEILARIWSEALKIDHIKPEDDFFDLGGHSLIAVKVMMAIEKEVGKRLPLSALFENSTLEKLAKLIESDVKDIKWNSLVPIKATGSKPPLYIVHGWGLNVLRFGDLAKFIDPDQPIYGLQAKGLNGKDLSESSVEQIAANYIAEIVQQNPNGPYYISGYSSGGVIAFEMSKQLKEAGKEIPFLGLFDTYVEIKPYEARNKKGAMDGAIEYLLYKLYYSSIFFIRQPKAFVEDKINFTLGTLYNIYAKYKPKKEHSPESFDDIILKLKWQHDRSIKQYKYQPYDGHAYLFKANNPQTTYFPHFKTNGWKPFLLKGITVIDVEAAHVDYFKSSSIALLTSKIQQALDETKQK